MATQSSSTSVGVGSSNEPTIVEVIQTNRNPEIWQHYDLCKMSDGSMKARCKLCSKFINFSSNSTLKQHYEKSIALQSKPLRMRVNHLCHEREGSFCIRGRSVSTTIYKLCDSRRYGSTNVSTSSAPSSSSRSDQIGNNEFRRYTGTDWISVMGQEEFDSFDILCWWKEMKSQFLVLAIMARDLLSVQASTVASESVISLSGRVLSIRRTRLTPFLEMCICLKDHLDVQEHIQHTSNLEGECLDIEQQLLDVEAEAGYAINLSDEEIVLDEQARSGSEDSE
ncbi:zinc finger BED domain-containing protein RICESLEEPER 2 [Tanacetum coccineum]